MKIFIVIETSVIGTDYNIMRTWTFKTRNEAVEKMEERKKHYIEMWSEGYRNSGRGYQVDDAPGCFEIWDDGHYRDHRKTIEIHHSELN